MPYVLRYCCFHASAIPAKRSNGIAEHNPLPHNEAPMKFSFQKSPSAPAKAAPAKAAPAKAAGNTEKLNQARDAQLADPTSYINSAKFTAGRMREFLEGLKADPTEGQYDWSMVEYFISKVEEYDAERRANKAAKAPPAAPAPASAGKKAPPAAPARAPLPTPALPAKKFSFGKKAA